MGVFGSMIEARVRQILRKELGREIDIDFIGDGQFKCDHLQFHITPFYAAVNREGIFFVHNSRVVLILPWESILICKQDKYDRIALYLLVSLEQISQTARPTEYPFCYWHECKLIFKNSELKDLFIKKFNNAKTDMGFSPESLKLFSEWSKLTMSLPVSRSNFISSNSHLDDDQNILKAYFEWGRFNDSLRLLYFTGRKACEGKVPGYLIENAFKIFESRLKSWSSTFGKYVEFDSEILNLFKSTTELPFNSALDATDEWAIGHLSIPEYEWQSDIQGIPVAQRLSLVNVAKSADKKQSLFIWNDFREGVKAIIVDGLGFLSSDGSSNIGTKLGLLTLDTDQASKLSKLKLELAPLDDTSSNQ